jgi:hypothetical protein
MCKMGHPSTQVFFPFLSNTRSEVEDAWGVAHCDKYNRMGRIGGRKVLKCITKSKKYDFSKSFDSSRIVTLVSWGPVGTFNRINMNGDYKSG